MIDWIRRWWTVSVVQAPLDAPSDGIPAVGRLITPMGPTPTPEQLAHHARRKSRQNAHVATQAVVAGGF